MRKLSRHDANTIRAEIANGATRRACAARFGISLSQVDRIVNGQSWVGRPVRHRKLANADVLKVRSALAAGCKVSALAHCYGVSHTLISLIFHNKRRVA